jgi:hypothetical protein
MNTILCPDRFLLRSYDDMQVLTAFSLRSPRFSRTWLDVVRTWPSVKGVLIYIMYSCKKEKQLKYKLYFVTAIKTTIA